ncbi:hypothetical protein ROA7450_02332 [Roseovarius albus]|uniref:Uncharacterized protein n=2 Tax=Roseovarius albus TaxID=1247867 RepID=A0A1X6ZCJ7_9RHOB|nr:hypothetical protein ROA7450_02332 [Roseovarius albus]
MPPWLFFLFAIYVLLPIPPVVLKLFEIHYLASPNWIERTRIWDMAFGLFLICLIGFYFLKHWQSRKINSHEKTRPLWIWACFAIPILNYTFLFEERPLAYGIPIIAAAITNEEVQFSYTVERAYPYSLGECKNPIEVLEAKSTLDEICNAPNELVNQLKRGDTVIVSGKGTQMGLFPESVRKVE